MLHRRRSDQCCRTHRTWCVGRHPRFRGRHQIDLGLLNVPEQGSHAVVRLDEVLLARTYLSGQNVGPSGRAEALYRRPRRDGRITVCNLLANGVSLPFCPLPLILVSWSSLYRNPFGAS